jgi:hypothetical protein
VDRPQVIRVSVLPQPEVVTGIDTELELELGNTADVACLDVVVEFAVRRPLLLTHGDRSLKLERLGPGEHHRHPIRLRSTAAGSGEIVLRVLSYGDTRGRVFDAAGTTLAVTVTPSSDEGIRPDPAPPVPVDRSAVAGSPSVFISHRSTDSPWFVRLVVNHLREALRPHRVFVDSDLRGGQLWRDQLDTELHQCAAFVALIGPDWRSGSEVLQWEIRTALDREILLLPVLFDGARMPRRAELPDDIRALADRHTVRVDPTHLPDDLMTIELEVREALRRRASASDSG